MTCKDLMLLGGVLTRMEDAPLTRATLLNKKTERADDRDHALSCDLPLHT